MTPSASASRSSASGSDAPPTGAGQGADIAGLSFEQALAELETIVRALEQGNVDLDRAVDAYERGVALKRHCEARLADARMKVERLSVTADGDVTTAPLDPG